MTIPDRLQTAARLTAEFFQDQWFDRTRNVRTSGEVSLRSAGADLAVAADSEAYQPARPAHIRQALRDLPVSDVSKFTYIDLGSGKGRTLFIAAEQLFHHIVGVELTPVLHAQACANVRRFRWQKGGCRRIDPVQQNATDFVFPAGKIVLYMFNPFGVATVRQVLQHLMQDLQQHPRHVVIVLFWPQWENEVATLPGMQLWRRTEAYCIYEAYHNVE